MTGFAKKNLHGKSGTYHLAEALTSYTLASGSSLERKTDILIIISQQVESMLLGLDMVSEMLQEIDFNIDSLIDSDVYMLDQEVDIPLRKEYKKLQKRTYRLLFGLIREHNLITSATLREYTGSWGGTDDE